MADAAQLGTQPPVERRKISISATREHAFDCGLADSADNQIGCNNAYYCTAVRREIGKEQRVKVSNRKGIANQTGPESCVAHREVRDEALTGEPAGQPLSRESNKLVQGADAVVVAEGNTDRRDSASAWMTLRGLRPWHVGKFRAREPGDLLLGRSSCNGAVRIGKTRSRSR